MPPLEPAIRQANSAVDFERACAIAGRAVPTGQKAGKDFADACLSGAKVKAELLSKTLSSSYAHHELLDLSAGLAGFQSWDELNHFARNFAKADDAERASWHQSLMLAALLWALTPAHEANELVQTVLRRTLQALLTFCPEDIDRPAAELILRRIIFQKDTERTYWGENKVIMQEVMRGLHYYLGLTSSWVLLSLLTRVPVVEGRHGSWPPLTQITVGQLLDMSLANKSNAAGFGYTGWAHAVADAHHELETVYAKFAPASESRPWNDPDGSVRKKRAAEIELTLASPLCRIICRDFLTQLLKPYLKLSVENAFFCGVGETGFYASFYSGSPEKVEADWAKNYGMTTAGIKRVVFREPFGEFFLSLFRIRRWFESSGARLYEFEAVVHDRNDELVAKLGLALFIGEGDTSPYDLAWSLDQHDHDDLREVGLGLAQAVYRLDVAEEALDRVMVLREWEVREGYRREGLGKKLLNEAIRRSVRGLATPSILACRVCPLLIPTPPYNEWVEEAARGNATGPALELASPVLELQEIFRRCVGPGTFVGDKGIEMFNVPYLPWVHRGHELTLLAMQLAKPPAGYEA